MTTAHKVHVTFPGRLVVVGFGSIGQGVLPLILRHIGGLSRDLLRQRDELIALLGHRLELLSRMGARQLDHLRKRLRRDQLDGKIE